MSSKDREVRIEGALPSFICDAELLRDVRSGFGATWGIVSKRAKQKARFMRVFLLGSSR